MGSNIPEDTPSENYNAALSAIAEKTKTQLERFKEAAKSLGTDDREETFDRALKKVAKPPAAKPEKHS